MSSLCLPGPLPLAWSDTASFNKISFLSLPEIDPQLILPPLLLILATCRLLIITPVVLHWPQSRIRCKWRAVFLRSFCFKAVKRTTSLSCSLQLASVLHVGLYILWAVWSKACFNHITGCSLTFLYSLLLTNMAVANMFLWFLEAGSLKTNYQRKPMLYLSIESGYKQKFKKFCFNILLTFQTILLPIQLQLLEFLFWPHNNGTAFRISLTILDSNFVK